MRRLANDSSSTHNLKGVDRFLSSGLIEIATAEVVDIATINLEEINNCLKLLLAELVEILIADCCLHD